MIASSCDFWFVVVGGGIICVFPFFGFCWNEIFFPVLEKTVRINGLYVFHVSYTFPENNLDVKHVNW